mmetsp:Transcript_19019/g.35508  ORF Transcript_19019/g.35508 Transcript_19019/m.35508 type:complete len:574 (-) Transcript_19019:105-1826(-)
MSVNRLLCILWFCALEENILATHDELSQLQIKLEMKASPRDKDSISLAEQVRSVELKRGDVASFNFTQPIERNIASSTGSVAWERNAQNVLFIVADDLRSLISGVHMHTPHLNAFAKESLVLTNSHVQQALCSPSRASILFGRRPDTMHVWDASQTAQLRNYCKTCKTIPELFKDAGYYTIGMGKVFDDGGGGEVLPDTVQQDEESWSDPSFAGENWFYGEPTESDPRTPAYSAWEIVDESETGPLQDSQVRDHAVKWLRTLAERNTTKPWFIAVGFRKPHLPFTCPDEFYNLYSVNDIQLASNPFAPPDMPPIAWTYQEILKWNDVKATAYTGAINETLNECKAKELVRGYQACISYHDYNVGTLLNELKALGHWEDTIILFWSDHGYKLGEHGGWAKSMNFHLDTSAPIILRVPGLTDGGVVSDALVEHVDVMATLLGAAGLNPPPICSQNQSWMIRYCTEGRSFLDLASNPWATWKNASFSQFDRDDRQYMGYSMNTNTKLRFTAWVDFDNVAFTTNFSMTGEGCGFELYNHSTDPHENDNLAYRSGYGILVQELFQQLKLGWRATNTLI